MQKMTYEKFKQLSVRKDVNANDIAHFFSHRFAEPLAYFFYRLGATANIVTWIFLLFGLIAAFSIWAELPILAYFFWRMHIVADMADGTIARATHQFSKSADGFDRSNHIVINTSVVFAAASSIENVFFVMFLLITFNLFYSFSINYYTEKKETRQISLHMALFRNIIGLEGFIFFTVFFQIFDKQEYQPIIILIYGFTHLIMYLRKLQIFINEN